LNLNLKVIPVELISVYWDQLSLFIEDALKKSDSNEYNLDDIRNMLEAGVWTAIGFFDPEADMHGALTVTVLNYPQERVAFVTAIGGKELTNEANWQQLRDICKTAGCSKLQAYSRESVARLWKRIGFRNRAILVEADV
jgi:hypothetical protein